MAVTPPSGAPVLRRPTPGRAVTPVATVAPRQARAHNRAVVLRTLFRDGLRTRADLARATGLTSVTVSEIVAGLLADGLVEEAGLHSTGGVGKRGMLLRLRSDRHHVVAVHLRGLPEVGLAVLDLDGRTHHEEGADFSGMGAEEALSALLRLCAGAVAATAEHVLGVGVAVSGLVDHDGRVLTSANLPWQDVPLAAVLSRALGTGVQVLNDADAAAMAERTYGRDPREDFIVVTLGHGVGAGLVLEGRLVRGNRRAAGEIGHLVVEPGGARCGCGRRGCLETVVSEPHLRGRLAGRGDAGREEVLHHAGRRLGAVLAPVVSALDLEQVLLTGSDDLLTDSFLDAARETVHEACLAPPGGPVEVRRTTLGRAGVLQGAVASVLAAELGVG